MKFSKLDLLTLLISLFLFSSCKDSSSIGLDVNPNTAIKGTLIDTITVTSSTVKDTAAATFFPAAGSVGSSGITRYPLGDMTDAIFGSTTASVAMSVNLPGATGYSFGTNAVIDSAVLVMPFQNTVATAATTAAGISPFSSFYGDSTSTFTVTVNQLTANLLPQTSWLSNKTYAAGDQLGTFTSSVKPSTPVNIINVISGAPDTAMNVVPEIRIKLNPSLIQARIMNLDSVTLSTNGNLNAAFKGLKVTATRTSKSGGIMFLDFSGANSNLEIYYKNQNATTATLRDTVVAKFPILTSTNPVAASVTHDYSNTVVDAQIKNPKDYAVTYLQAMGGVRNKITFPYLKNLKASIGSKIIINKAELVIDINDPADSIPFKIPPRLALYRYDIAQQRQQLPDNNPASSSNPNGDPRGILPFGGYYDPTKKSYTFAITNYVQDIVDGNTVDYGTYLAPTAATEFNVPSYPTSAGRAVIGSFNNPNNRKIRLNLYYTKEPN